MNALLLGSLLFLSPALPSCSTEAASSTSSAAVQIPHGDELFPEGSEWQGNWTGKACRQRGKCRSVRVVDRSDDRAVVEVTARNKSCWQFVLGRKGKRWSVKDVLHLRSERGIPKKIDAVKRTRVEVKQDRFVIHYHFQISNKTNKGRIEAKK